MPELAGTLLAVKERPKVAKRPTIVPPAVPNQPAAKKVLGFTLAARPAQNPAPAPVLVEESAQPVQPLPQPSKTPDIFGFRPSAESVLSEIAASEQPQTKPIERRIAIGSTIPVKKPLVARKPTILAEKPASGNGRTERTKSVAAGKSSVPSAPAAQAESKPQIAAKTEPKQALSLNWVPWIPIAVGIALASIAPQLHAFAAQWKPWGLRVLFPYVQLAALREIGMSDELTRTMPQLMLYLQFPLEGILVASNLRRGKSFSSAFGPVPALHFVGGLVLWIVALGQVMPL